MFAFKFNDVNTFVVPLSKLPDTDKPTAVVVPVKTRLAKRFVSSCASTPPYNDSHVKVPQVRSVVIFILFAVAVPVNVGLARGAFNAKSVVVALLFKEVNTLVVPISKLLLTVKLYRRKTPIRVRAE